MRKQPKVNWFVIGMPLALLFVPLTTSWITNAAGGTASMNPFFMITGSLAVAAAFTAFTHYMSVHGSVIQVNGFASTLTNRQRAYSHFGVFAGIFAFITGFTMLTAGGADPIEKPLMQTPVTACLFWINALLTAYFLYCFARFWMRYRVRNAWITILDGQIFYPNEDVTFYPWRMHEIHSIATNQVLAWKQIEVPCQDGVFKLGVVANIIIDIPTTQQLGTAHLDHLTFVTYVKAWFTDLLRRRSADMPLRDFLTTRQNGEKSTIEGIAVSWDGTVVLSHQP